MKICFKCNELKSINLFHKHNGMADGHFNICIICKNERQREYRLKNSYAISLRLKEKMKCLEAKKLKRNAKLKYKSRFPFKIKAVAFVNNHLRYNPEFRKPCIHCGKKAQAHHHDYSKPMDVIWLCPKHHAEEHIRLNKIGKDPDKDSLS